MEILNDNPLSFVVCTKEARFHDQAILVGNYFKWSRKVWVDKGCDCPNKKSYWIYYIYAYANGCPLETAQAELALLGPDEDDSPGYVFETEDYDGRDAFELNYEDEVRRIGLPDGIPQNQVERNSLYFDSRGSRKIGV